MQIDGEGKEETCLRLVNFKTMCTQLFYKVLATLSLSNFTRGHNYKLFKHRSKLLGLVKSRFFTNHIIDQWNYNAVATFQIINT